MVGMESMISTNLMSSESTMPPTYPATKPTKLPSMTAINADAIPIAKETLPPNMILAKDLFLGHPCQEDAQVLHRQSRWAQISCQIHIGRERLISVTVSVASYHANYLHACRSQVTPTPRELTQSLIVPAAAFALRSFALASVCSKSVSMVPRYSLSPGSCLIA